MTTGDQPGSLRDSPAESGWRSLALLTGLTVALLVCMEWVFFVTKPSFLSILGWPQRAMVLGLAPLPLVALAAGALVPLLVAARVAPTGRWRRGFRFGAGLVPTLVLGSLYMLLVDNFTNTVWGLALQSSRGLVRVLLAVALLGLFLLAYRSVQGWQAAIRRHFRVWAWLGVGLLAFSLIALVTVAGRALSGQSAHSSGLYASPARRPNILILGSDGLSADHLSCYGYGRETTPFLASLVPVGLLCENAFANCCHTTGSLASILTGRLPTATGVTYPPDILAGRDAFRHLPGLLHKFGYRSAQISIRHYGDAFDVNLRDGFDTANFRRRGVAQAPSRLGRYLGAEPVYFAEQILDRIGVRLGHAAGHNTLIRAYDEAGQAGRLAGVSDERRFVGLQEILGGMPEPFFAHAHFMGTHGSRFNLLEQVFSAGMEQDRGWIPEFYDDAIREFDRGVGRLLAVLEARGVLENTLVVIYSDHGRDSDSRQRVPLIFRFPGGEHAGRVVGNVQCLDIAPTLLDYLGVGVPGWMDGQSLLAGAPDPLRPVFSTRFRSDILRRVVPGGPFVVNTDAAGPPFHSMGSLIMVVAQRVYTLDLTAQELEIHDLPDHTAPRPESELPDRPAATALLIDHLAGQGFEVSGLRPPFAAPGVR